MHILVGKYKKIRLHSEPSPGVRPTARRVRERLFELLAHRIEGARFIDLCAGSGAVGIEALSRGAAHATFVDRSAPACTFIHLNLEACGVYPGWYTVVASAAFKFLHQTAERGDASWDIAFYDPPYATDYAPVLTLFATSNLLNPRGLLAVEHACKKQPEGGGALDYLGTAELGETCLSFYERRK
jgi:16S rRNA (guanine(966)-N(2))-methyltransferase RsmD